MKPEKEPKRVCDKCENFEISPGGCVETCHAVRTESNAAYNFQPYAEERMNGNKTQCKAYRKL